jgi:CRISPR-associated protein Cmr4
MADTAPATQAARLLFLHAQTGLHPGSGTALGVVDMPVQRERHTQFPTIPGSALKGILRDRCRENAKVNHGGDRKKANEDDKDLVAVFGPGKGDDASDHAGAIAITDARLACFPVRSLRGVFAWVTCPAVLLRMNRDLQLVPGASPLGDIPAVGDDPAQILCAANSPLRVNGDKVVLEEFEFTASKDTSKAFDTIATWFAKHATADAGTAARLKTHLAIIGDDSFSHYARHATEIVARVALNYDTKTVRPGALFYQELLPAETLLYALVLAHPSRKSGHAKTAEDVLAYVGGQLQPNAVLQIGGDETVGKGFCFAHLTDGKGN